MRPASTVGSTTARRAGGTLVTWQSTAPDCGAASRWLLVSLLTVVAARQASDVWKAGRVFDAYPDPRFPRAAIIREWVVTLGDAPLSRAILRAKQRDS